MATHMDDDLPPDPELNDSITDDFYHQACSDGPDADATENGIAMEPWARLDDDDDSDDDAPVTSARTRSAWGHIRTCPPAHLHTCTPRHARRSTTAVKGLWGRGLNTIT